MGEQQIVTVPIADNDDTVVESEEREHSGGGGISFYALLIFMLATVRVRKKVS